MAWECERVAEIVSLTPHAWDLACLYILFMHFCMDNVVLHNTVKNYILQELSQTSEWMFFFVFSILFHRHLSIQIHVFPPEAAVLPQIKMPNTTRFPWWSQICGIFFKIYDRWVALNDSTRRQKVQPSAKLQYLKTTSRGRSKTFWMTKNYYILGSIHR